MTKNELSNMNGLSSGSSAQMSNAQPLATFYVKSFCKSVYSKPLQQILQGYI